MWNMLEKLDQLFLSRVMTPSAHYIQIRFGISNYEVAYHCLETTAFLFFLLSTIDIVLRGEPASWWLLIDGASIAWLVTCGVILRNHMKRGDWYKIKPSPPINFLPDALWAALLVICVLMTWRNVHHAYIALTDNPYITVLDEKKQVYFVDSLLRAMLVLYPLGFYLERVNPLPPGSRPTEVLSGKTLLDPI
jgi:hypothetical protein